MSITKRSQLLLTTFTVISILVLPLIVLMLSNPSVVDADRATSQPVDMLATLALVWEFAAGRSTSILMLAASFPSARSRRFFDFKTFVCKSAPQSI